jgi:hypothetical protein
MPCHITDEIVPNDPTLAEDDEEIRCESCQRLVLTRGGLCRECREIEFPTSEEREPC